MPHRKSVLTYRDSVLKGVQKPDNAHEVLIGACNPNGTRIARGYGLTPSEAQSLPDNQTVANAFRAYGRLLQKRYLNSVQLGSSENTTILVTNDQAKIDLYVGARAEIISARVGTEIAVQNARYGQFTRDYAGEAQSIYEKFLGALISFRKGENIVPKAFVDPKETFPTTLSCESRPHALKACQWTSVIKRLPKENRAPFPRFSNPAGTLTK